MKKVNETLKKRLRWKAVRSELSEDDFLRMARLAANSEADPALSNPEFLRWQYLRNPAGKATVWLAKDDNNVIGQVVFLPVKMKYFGEELAGVYAANIITDIKYRNKGVFAILAQKAFEELRCSGIKVLYGVPNKSAYPTWIKRTDYRDIGVVPDLLNILNPGKFIEQKLNNKLLRHILRLFTKVVFFSRKAKTDGRWSINEIKRFNDNFDSFWETNSAYYDNIIVRRREYLNWRYFECPLRDYRVYSASLNGEMCGYIVLRVVDDANTKTGWIVDLFSGASKKGLSASRILVSEAMRVFKTLGVDIVRTVVPKRSIAYRALRRSGFWPVPGSFKTWPIRVIWCSFLTDRTLSLDQLYFTLGDNDVP